MHLRCTYKPHPNGSSALHRFEHSNTVAICNRIMFDFCLGLPHIIGSSFCSQILIHCHNKHGSCEIAKKIHGIYLPACTLRWPLGVAASPPWAASSLSGTPPWPGGVRGQRSGVHVSISIAPYPGVHHSIHIGLYMQQFYRWPVSCTRNPTWLII